VRLFFDDSGDFRPGKSSLHVAVIVPSRVEAGLRHRLRAWEQATRRVSGQRDELKASRLSDDVQASFVREVLRGEVRVTITGFDGNNCDESGLAAFRAEQAARISPAILHTAADGRDQLNKQYKALLAWWRRRSTQEIASLFVLPQAIYRALQHAIILSSRTEQDGTDLSSIELHLDRSFIRRASQVQLWLEYLRISLESLTRTRPFLLPETWGPEHSFRRAFEVGEALDLTPVFRDRMGFVDSARESGVRVADFCANIAYRFLNHGASESAFDALRPMIQMERSPSGRVTVAELLVLRPLGLSKSDP
jgi:hypothetical protein